MERINLAEKFALVDAPWTPKIVGVLDDYEIKVVKLEGDFVWHKHDDEDELFLVVAGGMWMDFRDRQVALVAGEMIVVPKGVEHKPRANAECQVLLFERQSVVNTGDAGGALTVSEPERI